MSERAVYIIQAKHSRRIKVGVSRDPVERLAELQCGNPEPLILLASRPGSELHERMLHATLPYRLEGEWFEWSDIAEAHVRGMRGEIKEESFVAHVTAMEMRRWRLAPLDETTMWLEGRLQP
jgi:hypothetical protein